MCYSFLGKLPDKKIFFRHFFVKKNSKKWPKIERKIQKNDQKLKEKFKKKIGLYPYREIPRPIGGTVRLPDKKYFSLCGPR